MNERSTHLNAFIYDSTPIRIVSLRYRTLLISSTTVVVFSYPRHRRFRPRLPIVVLFLRRFLFPTSPLCESHESSTRIVVSTLSFVHPCRPFRYYVVPASSIPYQRSRFRRPSHRTSRSRVKPLSSSPSRPVSSDTHPSLSRYRVVSAFIAEPRAFTSTHFVVLDCIVVSRRKRHAAGFGGAADATRRRLLPAASSSPSSSSPKRSLYRRLSTVASSRVSAKLRNTKDNAWPVAS